MIFDYGCFFQSLHDQSTELKFCGALAERSPTICRLLTQYKQEPCQHVVVDLCCRRFGAAQMLAALTQRRCLLHADSRKAARLPLLHILKLFV